MPFIIIFLLLFLPIMLTLSAPYFTAHIAEAIAIIPVPITLTEQFLIFFTFFIACNATANGSINAYSFMSALSSRPIKFHSGTATYSAYAPSLLEPI